MGLMWDCSLTHSQRVRYDYRKCYCICTLKKKRCSWFDQANMNHSWLDHSILYVSQAICTGCQMFAAFVEMPAFWLHLFNDVTSYTVCECAPFCTVLFVFCLSTKRPSDCGKRKDGDGPSVALVVFFFPSLINCIRWLCFRCRCVFVVNLLLVATVLQQMRHTGSSRLSGSPRSVGLNPKCSHTAAVVFGF